VARLPAEVGDRAEAPPRHRLAAAGGWSDTATLKRVYQQADQETMYRVVSEPARLREVR
jgi:hypothetical protein